MCAKAAAMTAPACTHENMTTYWEIDWEYDYEVKMVDDKVHQETGYRIAYPMCADCGKIFYDEPGASEPFSETSVHTLTDSANGIMQCTQCEFKLNTEEALYDCYHAETYQRQVSYDACQPVEGGEGHIMGVVTAQQTVCKSCSAVVAEEAEFTPADGATAEDHIFENGRLHRVRLRLPRITGQRGKCSGPIMKTHLYRYRYMDAQL